MKNFTVIHILLFILMMLVAQCAQAQDFVVTAKGDSISGKVRPLHSSTDPKVQVTPENGKKQVFSVLQVQRFRYRDELFKPVRFNNRYAFMKVLKDGYLSLFAFQVENQVTFDGLYLTKKDGTGMEVPNLVFKKAISKYLSDCPSVSKSVESGDLGKRDIEKIVDEYNGCIDRNTSVTTIQTKKMGAWDVLHEKVKAKPDFQGKSDALEMISEIKLKVQRSEKVPSFMIEGLKNSLANAELAAELQNALNEMSN
jgi:hypothetical protein